jgi:hypothetical protein
MIDMENPMKSSILHLYDSVFSLAVLLVPIVLGLFLSLRMKFGSMQARQTYFSLLKIGLFLALGCFGLVLLGIVLHQLLI